MILYKLTDENGMTGRGYVLTNWHPGVTPEQLSGEGGLCGCGWYHAYEDPLIAVLHNPIHANFSKPRCFRVRVRKKDVYAPDQMKCGFRTGRTLREIALPEVTTEQRVRYAIGCASIGCHDGAWIKWASSWLRDIDRSADAARAAAYATYAANAANAAAYFAYAANAAYAARAAHAAAYFAYFADAADAARAAHADHVGYAAAHAAVFKFDLLSVARWAMTDDMEFPEVARP